MGFNHAIALAVTSLAAALTLDARAEVVVSISGTNADPVIRVSVVGNDSFASAPATGVIDFTFPPIVSGSDVIVEGPLGPSNPWIVRPVPDSSALRFLRISSGNFSDFVLDEDNPITSSSNVVSGLISDLAALDGVTTNMTVSTGSGPSTAVTVHYDADRIVLDIDGTPSAPRITASVVGDSSFTTRPATGVIDFSRLPTSFATVVEVEGPFGPSNPWILRGPADGSYLNLLRISTGDFSDHTLDESNPLTSSSNVVSGGITDLAAFDGMLANMTLSDGSGRTIDVAVNYNVAEAVPALGSRGALGLTVALLLVGLAPLRFSRDRGGSRPGKHGQARGGCG